MNLLGFDWDYSVYAADFSNQNDFFKDIPFHAMMTLNALEGYSLSIDDTRKVILEHKGADIPLSAVRALDNFRRASAFLKMRLNEYLRPSPLRLLDIKFCQNLNRYLVHNVVDHPGELRTISVAIRNTNYIPPKAESLYSLMSDGFDFLRNIALDIPTTAFVLFLFVARTQPFEDGNKRTGALMMNALLLDNGFAPVIFNEPHQILMKKMKRFYESADASEMMEFLDHACEREIVPIVAQDEYFDVEF